MAETTVLSWVFLMWKTPKKMPQNAAVVEKLGMIGLNRHAVYIKFIDAVLIIAGYFCPLFRANQ